MVALPQLLQVVQANRQLRKQEEAIEAQKAEASKINLPGALAGIAGALFTGGGALPALLGGVAGATGGAGGAGIARGLTTGISGGQAAAQRKALTDVLDQSGLGEIQQTFASQYPEIYAKSIFPDPLTAALMAKAGIDLSSLVGGKVAPTTQAPTVQKIRVSSPEGKTGQIPVEDMDEALAKGFKLDVSGSALDRNFLSDNTSKFGLGG